MAAGARHLAAIMFTDMVGYTALAQADEAVALGVLERHNRLLRPIFGKYRGREVKTVGDAFLVEFGSALEAAQCAVEIQRMLHDYNLSSDDEWKIRIRIGIHVGDVVRERDDVLGDAVNVASRIEPLAEPGGICVSQQAFDQIQNKIVEPLVPLPAVRLKNVRVPVGVYRVVQPWDAAMPVGALPPTGSGHHLAVLPLSNISPDPKDEYFADGLTEELIAVLSKVRGLSVIARTSVAPYKTAPKSIAQVGVDLGVDAVIEGSVRKAGNRLRITLQLIDVSTQRHIWAESYNREVDDVFAVQTDVAERTAEALQLEFAKATDASGPGRRPTENAAAYDQYLRGLVAARRPDGTGLARAEQAFEEATRLDPKFATAFAVWGDLYVVLAGDSLPMRVAIPKAQALAARALELDPDSSEAHSTLGNIAMQFDHDWARAEAEFRTALRLNPSNVTAHRFYGLMLTSQGRFDEAMDVFRRTVQLDPGGSFQGMFAWAELQAGRVDDALRDVEETTAKGPLSVGDHTMLAFFYLEAGRPDLARTHVDVPADEASPVEAFDLALLQAIFGRPAAARALADAPNDNGSYTSDTHRAMLLSVLGEKDRALELLEKELVSGDPVLWLFHRGVFFDNIRDDPRFTALLRAYGLPLDPLRRPRMSP